MLDILPKLGQSQLFFFNTIQEEKNNKDSNVRVKMIFFFIINGSKVNKITNIIANILLKNLFTFSLNDKRIKKSRRLLHYDEESNEQTREMVYVFPTTKIRNN